MGPNYGTNKITTSQQNPMLSRQLSVSGAGYSHGAALHTPGAQPYHRAPRPHLGAGNGGGVSGAGNVGGVGGVSGVGGVGVVGGGGAGGASEFVRNELRNMVSRARPDLHPLQPPDMDPLMSFDMTPPEYYGGGLGGGGVGGGR